MFVLFIWTVRKHETLKNQSVYYLGEAERKFKKLDDLFCSKLFKYIFLQSRHVLYDVWMTFAIRVKLVSHERSCEVENLPGLSVNIFWKFSPVTNDWWGVERGQEKIKYCFFDGPKFSLPLSFTIHIIFWYNTYTLLFVKSIALDI